jgi:hypothetical protein
MTSPNPQELLLQRARELIGNSTALIACCPVDTSGLPASLEIPQPTLSHTIGTCAAECGRDVWIGPTQLLAASQGLGVVLCYHCLIPVMVAAQGSGEVQSLASTRQQTANHDAPRREHPMLVSGVNTEPIAQAARRLSTTPGPDVVISRAQVGAWLTTLVQHAEQLPFGSPIVGLELAQVDWESIAKDLIGDDRDVV